MYGIDLFSPINSYCVCIMAQWYGVLSVTPLLLLLLYGVTMQPLAARRAASVLSTLCTVLGAYMSITSICCLVWGSRAGSCCPEPLYLGTVVAAGDGDV